MRNGSRAPEEVVRRVSGEIDVLRNELGSLVAELDRRRLEALDIGLQVRRHPVLVASLAAVGALLLGATIAAVVRGRRERRRPAVRARETGRALSRLFERPDRVAAEPSIPNKVVTAVGVALASAITKRLVERAIRPTPP